MRYRFFSIPVQDAAAAQEELNQFLAAHRIVAVDKVLAADTAPKACRSAAFPVGQGA